MVTGPRLRIYRWAKPIGNLLALLFGVTTLLFFALRATGDPIVVLAGSDASPEQIELIRAEYGFDKPLIVQYARYLANVAQLEFGVSLATGQPAFAMVLERLPATLLLAVLGLGATILLAVPLGAWLGFRPRAAARRCVAGLVYIFQGIPGFVVALILIHVFVVQLMWLPSLGYRDIVNWILPAIALASFLAPKLTRVIAANVTETMREDYIQTAKAAGAPESEVLLKYALPNALLGAAALIGAQFALLISGAVIIEVLFLWPGIGLLLLKSTLTLDFPVVQAFAFVVAVLIFVVNSLVDLLFRRLDPRLEGAP